MKLLFAVAGILGVLLIGCESPPEYPDLSSADAWLATAPTDTAVRNAIIEQRTVFPYHFAPGSAHLNSLGAHDVAVLAAHFKDNPGPLSIRRGDAPQELYQARVQNVAHALGRAGVDANSIKITDALPSGDGMASESVLMILRKEAKESGQTQGYSRPVTATPMGAVESKQTTGRLQTTETPEGGK